MNSFIRFISVLAALPAVGVACYCWYIFHHGELADKSHWAALQSVEYRNRPNRDAGPLLELNIDGSGSNAVGVRGRDTARTRVWVMLNVAESDGDPMVLRRGVALELRCDQLGRSVGGLDVLTAVRKLLFDNCTASG